MDTRPIGVFDSGIGGLTAVKECMHLLPHEKILYFGDTGRVPYGSRSNETITRYSMQNIRFLLMFHVKAVLVACGTASSVAFEKLQSSSPVPVVGVLTGSVEEALSKTKNKRIGVIGTEATIRSGMYKRLLAETAPGVEVYEKACPLFVPLVENGHHRADDPLCELVVSDYLTDMRSKKIDTLILGCTHYPLLGPSIQNFMGNQVSLIDSGALSAKTLLKRLMTLGLEAPATQAGSTSIYVSDNITRMSELASIFLDQPIAEKDITLIDIELY